MARGDLLKKLFISHISKNDNDFKSVAENIVREELRKGNSLLAKDLQKILDADASLFLNRPDPINPTFNVPVDTDHGSKLIDVIIEKRRSSEIILKEEKRNQVKRILEEISHAELLNAHGLKPRSKILFCGPPGCGKTLCAKILASELGFPMAYVRFDALITSFMGETASNLRKVFDFVSEGSWVLLFDEFDAIGKGRNDPNEHGELKRVVNSFLQQLDRFKSSSLLIAATNHERLLDTALWRRFDDVIYFQRPDRGEIADLINLKLRNFPHKKLEAEVYAESLVGTSHSDIENICLDSIKSSLIQGRDEVTTENFEASVRRYMKRVDISLTSMEEGGRKQKLEKVNE